MVAMCGDDFCPEGLTGDTGDDPTFEMIAMHPDETMHTEVTMDDRWWPAAAPSTAWHGFPSRHVPPSPPPLERLRFDSFQKVWSKVSVGPDAVVDNLGTLTHCERGIAQTLATPGAGGDQLVSTMLSYLNGGRVLGQNVTVSGHTTHFPRCIQWTAKRPLSTNFLGSDGVSWAPPRPLPELLSALAPFFILLSLRPIDARLVRLVCLLLLFCLWTMICNVAIEQRFALMPLYRLGRYQEAPSLRWRAVQAHVVGLLPCAALLIAVYRFATASMCPSARALNAAWAAMRQLLGLLAVCDALRLAVDLAIISIDRAAIPPSINPYVIMAAIRHTACHSVESTQIEGEW